MQAPNSFLWMSSRAERACRGPHGQVFVAGVILGPINDVVVHGVSGAKGPLFAELLRRIIRISGTIEIAAGSGPLRSGEDEAYPPPPQKYFSFPQKSCEELRAGVNHCARAARSSKTLPATVRQRPNLASELEITNCDFKFHPPRGEGGAAHPRHARAEGHAQHRSGRVVRG